MRGTLIAGLQKTTTIDFPGKLACTVFTRGCNFRCPYCHNSTLVLDEKNKDDISKDEFIAFLKKRKGVLDGVCISGGEPLMHENLIDLIIKIKEMGYLVKLDTNGSIPKKLRDLISKGLIDYVAMDIKNSPENYVKAIGLNYVDIKNINESIELLKTNQVPFEFRTTAVKGIHDIEDLASISRWIQGEQQYYIQNYENSGDTIASRVKISQELESFTKNELESFLEVLKVKVPNACIRYA